MGNSLLNLKIFIILITLIPNVWASKTPTEALREHTKEFASKTIHQVVSGVYQAVGYGLANVMVIETANGVIIIDTLESVEAATTCKQDLRQRIGKKMDNPLAIIFTHSHTDHISGAGVFANKDTEVYAYGNKIQQGMQIISNAAFVRAQRQFGTHLQKGTELLNSGIGPHLIHDSTNTVHLKNITKELNQPKTHIEIDNIQLTMIHSPGETEDHITIWYPLKRMLFVGDDIYKAFPNIYTIRGAPTRNAIHWYTSIDEMIALQPEFLMPSHTQYVQGSSKIYEILTMYRDAIQYVHDQTVRYINKGWYLDDIVSTIEFPKQIQEYDYLQQFYGNLKWSIRGIFNFYLGWFSGNPAQLNPLSTAKKSQFLIEYMGNGVRNSWKKAKVLYAKKEYQMALELIDAIKYYAPQKKIRVTRREKKEWSKFRINCLRALALTQTSANGRNYYFTAAKEEEGLQIELKNPLMNSYIKTTPTSSMISWIKVMSTRLKSEKFHSSKEEKAIFQFSDTKEIIQATFRNGVFHPIVLNKEPSNSYFVKITTTTSFFKSLLSNSGNILRPEFMKGLITKDFKCAPSLVACVRLFSRFER